MDKSPKPLWGSPAFKDNNLSVNQGSNNANGNNNHSRSFNTTQSSNNNEVTRLDCRSSMSPLSTHVGAPMGTSSPNSPYYGNDNNSYKKQMSKGYNGGRNYAHDSGGPGGGTSPYNSTSPRFSSPNSPFGGRGRLYFHGSPAAYNKHNQSGGNNSSRSSFYGSPNTPGRSFHRDSTPYCSPNSSNVSFNQSFTAEDYFRPSMLEDPWERLRKRQQPA